MTSSSTAGPTLPALPGPAPSPAGPLLRLGVMAVAGAVCTVIGIGLAPSRGDTASGTAAVVNGIAVPTSEITTGTCASDPTTNAPVTGIACEREKLSASISTLLVEALARTEKVDITQAQIDNILAQSAGTGTTLDQLYASAVKAGFSKEQLDNYVRQLGLRVLLRKHLIEQTPPTEGNLMTYYNDHQNDFTTYQLAVIVMNNTATVNKVTPDAKAHPDKFANLAKAYSLDTTTKAKGGLLPNVTTRTNFLTLPDAPTSVTAGEVVGPFVDGANTDLFRIISIDAKTFEQAHDQVKNTVESADSSYATTLLAIALQKAGHTYGVKVGSRWGTWDYVTQNVVAK